MNVPEGFKQTEAGVIPNDWEVAELGQLADFLDGQRKPIKSSDREKMKGIYPYYGASGIIDHVNNYIFDDELILLGEDGENILSRNLRLAFIVCGKVWVNNHAHVLKVKNGDSTAFLAEKLESLNYEQYNSGTAQPKITKGTCAKIKISLPPTRAEQTAIAAALSDMDALIEGVEKLLEKKRRIKQGAMQELLTGKRRVSGFESQADFQQTEVGVIPKDWRIANLGELVEKFVNGGTPSTQHSEYWNGNIPWITGADILNQKIVAVRRYITNEAVQNSSTNVIKQGKLLFVSRTGVGKMAIAPFDIAISQDFTGIYNKPEILNISYLFWFLNFTQKELLAQNQGTSIQGITRSTLSSIKIPIPPTKSEQSAIAAILSDMDSEIEQLETQLAKYRQLKTGMMQELLTGKKRLV